MRARVVSPLLAVCLGISCASGKQHSYDDAFAGDSSSFPADGATDDQLSPLEDSSVDFSVDSAVDLTVDSLIWDMAWTPDLAPTPDLPPTPDTVPPPDTGPAVLTAPFSFDFENDDGQLEPSGDWEWGSLAFLSGPNCDYPGDETPPLAGHSGNGVWGTVLNDCYSPNNNASSPCSNQDTNDDSTLKLSFMIPASFQSAFLSYWEWTDYFLDFDWTEVYVNGVVASQDCTGSHTVPTGWVQRTVNLYEHIGKMVTVEFHFMATTVVNYSGWYLDDLSVTETL